MFTATGRGRRRARLKPRCGRTAQVAGGKGRASSKCPPALSSEARSPRSQSALLFQGEAPPLSLAGGGGTGSFTCLLIFPTPRNQSFAYIREGHGPASRRPTVFQDDTLLIGSPCHAEAEPPPPALPLGLCNSLGNRRLSPREAEGRVLRTRVPIGSTARGRAGRCSRSRC